ncbi:MAG: hypothetical protein IJG57_02260 [Firmicutes bacterium]|nr:hypothetical protein [Bacillota bacterium]
MKKKLSVWLLLMAAFAMVISFSACGSSDEEAAAEDVTEEVAEETVDGSAYGYAGTDPLEFAIYQYMAEEVSKNYDQAEVSIPTVSIFHIDYTNDEDVLAMGDFWLENYYVEGDTLKCVSGGNYPGVFHLKKDGENYTVDHFDVVADGAGFDASARELFGEYYEDFMKIYSDSDARNELRKITVSDYVNLNGLDINYYQDEGWDPVELYRQ